MTARRDGPLGRELTARRKAKGWTQRQLANAAGVGRTAVQYWEAAPNLDPRGWAVRRMAEALSWYLARFPTQDARAGWAVRPASGTNTRRRGDGLLDLPPAMQAWADAQLAAFKEREAARAAHLGVVCGAKTRKGTPCRNKSEPGRRRCKFHGGMSTGARTPEGIKRIRQAQRRRWARDRSAGEGADRQPETCRTLIK